ncbi:MAG: hypothetical protein EPN31_06015 [Castellaniella sp.]|uniref:hypothetical protein n=1 Tax=Castellaniella sp. TaxID=1955812 RepID=UPI0012231572|nr:hypothetical protein [Castellaniella sp.]TAN29684.1 MAG: hypothetical protein EPN31_06015 [Castellaniella sp.]
MTHRSFSLRTFSPRAFSAPWVADALRNVKGYKGAEGTYNFDKNGDSLHGYNIVQNKDGKIVFINHIEF